MPERNNCPSMNAVTETAVSCDQRKSVFVAPKLTFIAPKLVKQGSVKQLTNTAVPEDSL